MFKIRVYNQNYAIATREVNGVEHMVVPVVMMREGVHVGSGGALYHRAEELARYVAAWNGIPAVISHPQINGEYVSANSPDVIADYGVGTIYNAHMDGDKLKADVYLLQSDLERISPETLAMLTDGTPLDVSVGVFSDQIEGAGQWQGENYIATASNYRPDHLALLPHEAGACNWNDGCGIRTNSSNVKSNANEKSMDLKVFKAAQIKHQPPVIVNQDYRERGRNIQTTLDGMDVFEPDNARRVHYLQELYESYFVYKVNIQNGTEYYRQNYVMNASDAVEFVGEPVQVRREVSYTPVSPTANADMKRTKKNGKLINQSEEVTQMTIAEKADKLIAHSSKMFCASDREYLLTQTAEKLDGWQALAEANTGAPATPAAPVVQAAAPAPAAPLDMNAYLASLPAEMRDQVTHGLNLHADQRNSLVDGIIANAKDVWTKEELVTMSTASLQKIAKSIGTAPAAVETPANPGLIDYSLFGSQNQAPQVHAEDIPTMLPTGMDQPEK